MRRLKLLVAATAVVAGLVTTTNLAAARDLVLNPSDCVPPPPPPWQWYSNYYSINFVLDWGPFFRRHEYAYGPILACTSIRRPRW